METILIIFRRVACPLAVAIAVTSNAVAVAPNPLESAYWRFEEGTNFSNVDHTVADPVRDSTNANHLDAFNADTAPIYTSTVAPTALQSGLTNTLALDFIPGAQGGGDDLFTLFADGDLGKGLAKNINNGVIAVGGGFTVEAAFNTNNPARFQAIVGKEGRPALGKLGNDSENLQTFVIKTRQDNSLLQVEMWDGGAVVAGETAVQVSSLAPIEAGLWYNVAAVSDGTNLSLYLDSNDGAGYQLQGMVALNGGALYQGDDPENPSWDNSWTVGRGQYAGNPADWFDGIIDEVRLSNTALAPSQFLFAAPSEGVEGDYNDNGTVDAADYVLWRNGGPLENDPTPGVSPEDYDFWRARFGSITGSGSRLGLTAVPEPASIGLWMLAIGVGGLLGQRRSGRR